MSILAAILGEVLQVAMGVNMSPKSSCIHVSCEITPVFLLFSKHGIFYLNANGRQDACLKQMVRYHFETTAIHKGFFCKTVWLPVSMMLLHTNVSTLKGKNVRFLNCKENSPR